ncbi:hypothetical protein Tco_1195725 [Tanacetum coccineum]
MATEMELTLEQTQQGVSYEVSVDPRGFEGIFKDGDGGQYKGLTEGARKEVPSNIMERVDMDSQAESLGLLERIESATNQSFKKPTVIMFNATTRTHIQAHQTQPIASRVKGNDVPAYTERFQDLTLICTKFYSNETEKINKFIRGLPDNIYRNVKASKPKTLDETIELANDLMDQKLLPMRKNLINKRKGG